MKSGVRIVHNRLLGGWYVVRGPHQTPISGRFNSKFEAEAWLSQRAAKRNPRRRDGGKERSRKMALSVANKIADISSRALNGPNRGYLISEISLRLNRSDLTGALSVAWQEAKNVSPETTPFTLDRAAEDIVFKIAEGYTTKPAPRFRRNPKGRSRKAVLGSHGEFLRKIGRENLSIPGSQYVVQVKRGAGWYTLGAFRSVATATDYAHALHAKYPSRTFRVFQGGAYKKNPAPSRELKNLQNQASEILSELEYGNLSQADKVRAHNALALVRKDIREYHQRKRYKKNPIHANDPRVEKAARRFERFTGHPAESGQKVSFPDNPGAGLAVGPVLLVGYETVRDGKREKYIHRFASHARPLLVSSHDGRSLFLLGGAYRFTERGIVDSKSRR